MLHSDDLRRFQLKLHLEQERLLDQVNQMMSQRKILFVEGVREPSHRVQTALARQVRNLDMQMQGLQTTLSLLDLREQLVVHLVFAQENADRLDRHPFLGIDWEKLLADVSASALQEATRDNQIDELLRAFNYLPAILPAGDQMPSVPSVLESHHPYHLPYQYSQSVPKIATVELPPDHHPARIETALAVSVPDGDGLRLEDGRRVRYIGINAPEMNTWENLPEPYAKEARSFNTRLVVGKRVRLVPDVTDTDHYGRLLRFVYAGDVFINAEILCAGLAEVMTVKPNCSKAEEFKEIEAQAKKKRKGIWAEM